MLTDLTWLLPVGATGDVEEGFKNLDDSLRSFKGDGWCCWAQHTYILVRPLDFQGVLQSCSEDGHASLLEEKHDVCETEKTASSEVQNKSGLFVLISE